MGNVLIGIEMASCVGHLVVRLQSPGQVIFPTSGFVTEAPMQMSTNYAAVLTE